MSVCYVPYCCLFSFSIPTVFSFCNSSNFAVGESLSLVRIAPRLFGVFVCNSVFSYKKARGAQAADFAPAPFETLLIKP
jgi:hypothetical protein